MLRDLVDGHLMGKLTEAEQLKLREMTERDPLIAQYVKESEEAFALLQHARLRRLKKKLKIWDDQDDLGLGSGSALGVLLIISAVIVFFGWLGHYYAPDVMAMRSFEKTIRATNRDIHQLPSTTGVAGNVAFRNHDFQRAVQYYQPALESTDSLMVMESRWQILLCQLAIEGPTPAWQDAIQRFSSECPSVYKKEGLKLIRTLHSPTYILLYRNVFGKAVSTLKPKII